MNLFGTQGISFQVEMLEKGLNSKISFYFKRATSVQENIGNSIVY